MANRVRITIAARLTSKLERQPNGCLYFMGSRRKGYGQLGLQGNHSKAAHRVAWELANGAIPRGLLVLHRCDNRPCCDVDHLFLGTHADNTHDMMSKGRQGWHRPNRKGEANGRAKITAPDACGIYLDKRSDSIVGREYGISRAMVYFIREGKSWREATAHLRQQGRH